MLLDLLRPTSGSASILGFDCRRESLEVRRRVGYLPSEMPFYADQTGAGYLKFLSALGAQPASSARLESLFRRFDLSERDLRRRMRDYSHGMKRKIGLMQALMTDAPVLILDEPTSGLDPLMIEAFCETIDELARAGRTTIFLSSHVLSEVDRVCDRIALIRNGRLVAVRTLSELRQATPRRVTVTVLAAGRDASRCRSTASRSSRASRERWVIEARRSARQPRRRAGAPSSRRPQRGAVRTGRHDPALVRRGPRMMTLVGRSLRRIAPLTVALSALLAAFQLAHRRGRGVLRARRLVRVPVGDRARFREGTHRRRAHLVRRQ